MTKCLCVGALLIAGMRFTLAKETEKPPFIDAEAIVASLRAEGGDDSGLRRLKSEIDLLIERLIAILSDGALDAEVRIRAAQTLGAMRAIKAIPILLSNIRLSPELSGPITIGTTRPCVRVLVSIGTPASRAALDRIAEEDSFHVRGLLVMVIHDVEGYSVAQFLLQDKFAQASGTGKANLQAALKFLQQYTETPQNRRDRR